MEKNNSGDQIMTVQEVAAYLKINVYTLYKMAERGAIPAVKFGRIWRFRKSDVYKWLSDKMTREKQQRLSKWQKKYDKVMKEKP